MNKFIKIKAINGLAYVDVKSIVAIHECKKREGENYSAIATLRGEYRVESTLEETMKMINLELDKTKKEK